MKPETRAVLNEIGWQTIVEKYPTTAIDFIQTLVPRPGLQQARGDLGQIEDVRKAIAQLSQAISALPERLVSEIDHWSASKNELEEGIPALLQDALRSSSKVLIGLEVSKQSTEGLISKVGPGSTSPRTGKIRGARSRPGDDAAYQIAIALSEVYLLGCRKRPTAGKNAKISEVAAQPNGLFQKTLKRVLEIEGRGNSSAVAINNMALGAKRELTFGRAKKILADNIKTKARWGGQWKISLITGLINRGGISIFEYAAWQKVMSDD